MGIAKKLNFAFLAFCTLFPASFSSNLPFRALASSSIEEARASSASNLVEGAELSSNIRDSSANGMAYSDGTYSMTYTGAWLHSRTLCQSTLLDQAFVALDSEKIATTDLDVYYKAIIKYTDSANGRFAGFIMGRASLTTGEDVYLSCNLIPTERKLCFYYYKKNGGEADQYKMYDITSVSFAPNFNYTLEALRSDGTLSVYVNKKLIVTLNEVSNDASTSTDPSFVETIRFSEMIPAVGPDFCDISATLSNLTMKYLNVGTYGPYVEHNPELEEAENSNNEDIFAKATVSTSGNKRDPEANGFTFDGQTARMEYTGGWLRAINVFTNSYFDSNTLIMEDGSERPTKGVDAFYRAKFKAGNKESNRVLGLVVGKVNVLNQDVYLSVNICPESGDFCLYFATSNPYDFTYSINFHARIAEGEEHELEVLLIGGSLKAYLDGKKGIDLTEFEVSAYLHPETVARISISNLTPCFGTNFMDIDAEMYGFQMKYLAEYKEISVFVEPTYPDDSHDYVYNTNIPEVTSIDDEASNQAKNASFILLLAGGISAGIALMSAVIVIILYRKRRKAL
ncbi:MAG: hypothetical protein J5736_05675 [Bacilli bacterium]|nr:hypothetical protein [Bacilli bacterium]